MPDPTELFEDFQPATPDPATARGYINQHRGAMANRDKEMADVKGQQQANIDQMSKLLDETVASLRASREGRMNLPLMAMGAGMMSGTGNFGQQLGAGVRAMVPAIAAQREDDDAFQGQLSNIALKRAGITNAPLDEQLRYLKALQVGDINAVRGIESALIKSSGRGQTQSVDQKNYDQYLKEVPQGEKPKTFSEFLQWKAGLTDRASGIMREYAEFQKTNPAATITDFYAHKAKAGASGKATGAAEAGALESLPGLVNNAEVMSGSINQILSHPGLPKAVGLTSVLPSIPGGESADFEAQLDKLKGQAFLQMFNQLRGGGAITEMEGKKATDALAALSTKQSEKQFRANLKEVNDILAKGIGVARQKAGIDPMRTGEPAPAAAPKGAAPTETPSMGAFDPGASYKEGTIRMDRATKEKQIFKGGKWEKFGG